MNVKQDERIGVVKLRKVEKWCLNNIFKIYTN